MQTTARLWQTARRDFDYKEKTLIMGILNVTPDSFSDGGKFIQLEQALSQAELMIEAGADILDVGGESTRPGSQRISLEEEAKRVLPVIAAIAKQFKVAISIDTTKAEIAQKAIDAGAEIINDISGLRFDSNLARIAAQTKAGLVLMHSRSMFETLHKQEEEAVVEHILPVVIEQLDQAIAKALNFGVESKQIALDPGIGFGKTFEQNLELLARLDEICSKMIDFPFLVGTSRKSFIGKILNDAPVSERIHGTMASIAIAVFNGANIIRVHDVKAAAQTARVARAIKNNKDGHS